MPVIKNSNTFSVENADLKVTIIANDVIQSLENDEIGVFVRMLQMPADKNFSREEVEEATKCDRDKLLSVTRKLKRRELLTISPHPDGGWQWNLCGIPTFADGQFLIWHANCQKEYKSKNNIKSLVNNILESYPAREEESLKKKKSLNNYLGSLPSIATFEKISRKGVATRLTEDFIPTDKLLAWAQEKYPTVDVAIETEMFNNHFVDLPGRYGLKVHWDRTWQNWILGAFKRQCEQGTGSRNGRASNISRSQAAADEAIRRLRDEEKEANK